MNTLFLSFSISLFIITSCFAMDEGKITKDENASMGTITYIQITKERPGRYTKATFTPHASPQYTAEAGDVNGWLGGTTKLMLECNSFWVFNNLKEKFERQKNN